MRILVTYIHILQKFDNYMMEVEIRKIFENVQKSTSSHLKYVKVLSNIYEKVPFEDFLSEFFKFICILLQQKIGEATQQVQKCFKFCASFSIHLIDQDAKGKGEADLDASHPFLMRLLQELLKFYDLDYVQVRFHACQFIAILLSSISEDVTLDNDLCDDIQKAMLERITELKPLIRVQAVTALGRLQDISNNDCPVIKAYIAALGDPNSMVRKEVLDKIAPCPLTFGKIVDRTRDVDHTVRMSAFVKLTLIGPKVFRIMDRQVIALTGINEQNKAARNSFVKLLIKWLSTYDDDYIKLLNALKLDADEEDFKKTTFIYEKILDIFCGMQPVKEMISVLQLDDNNLVTPDKLNIETVMYWYHLLNYFESKENMQEYYEMIAPGPLPLIECITMYIKDKTSSQLDDWEYLEFQHILCKLLQIAKKIDLADEASRNALHRLTIKEMTEIKLDNFVLSEMINILKKIFPDFEQLSNEIFSVIAEVREPLVEDVPDSYLLHEKDFKIAQIRVKLHILQDEMQEAVSKEEFLIAAAKEKEHAELEEKLKDLQQNFVVKPKVRKVQNDLKTTCYCLDVVISLLQNTEMQTLPLSITQFKQEFVETYSETTNADLYYKILKFNSLYAFSDEQFAFDKIKTICSPIIVYRLVPQYDKAALLLSIDAFSDLLRVYGPNILNPDSSVETNSKHATGRRLYDHTQLDISDEINLENITCGMVIDVILDIMNDEMQDVRECATTALCRLVERGLVVSSTLITRLLLKLFNPLTEKQDQKIQQMLSFSITRYAQVIEGSANILENAILPTLCSIGNAPKTSPLSEINVSSVLQFLAALTRVERNEFSNTHKHLTYSIFETILKKPEDKCACILSMMLQYLDEPVDDQIVIAEINKFIENSLKVVRDKQVIKYLSKYSRKLAGYSVSTCRVTGLSLATRTSSQVNESNPELLERVAVEPHSINSCRATKGSVNSNRDTEDFIHSTATSVSLQTNEQNGTGYGKTLVQKKYSRMKCRNNSTHSLSESNTSDSSFNSEFIVSGVNRQSLRRLNATVSESFTKKTQKKPNKSDLNKDKTSTADSDSEGDSRKKRWRRRKRSNILQLTEKDKSQTTNIVDETAHHLECMNGDQNLSNNSPSKIESSDKDAGNVRRSNRIRKNLLSANKITQSVIIYVPRMQPGLNTSKALDNSTASSTDNSPKSRRPSRSVKNSKENMSINDQPRRSMRTSNPPRVSSTSVSFTPENINDTRKNSSSRNLRDSLRRSTRQENGSQLNLTNTNNSTQKVLNNSSETKRTLRRLKSKRNAKSETSGSDCSSRSLKKVAKKKAKIFQK